MHPIRAYLERVIRDRISRSETEDQEDPAYSPALFVQRRLLEFKEPPKAVGEAFMSKARVLR